MLFQTSEGYQQIHPIDLEDQWVDVWNGDEWSNVQVKKTGTNQELVTVRTSAGIDLACTPYHKFYVKTGYKGTDIVERRAFELQKGTS